MVHRDIEYAEKRMRQKWHDLVMEEQKGASMQVLERMFNAYMLSLEEYNRCVEVVQQDNKVEHMLTRKKAS
jgi:uncharacterized protein YqgQ